MKSSTKIFGKIIKYISLFLMAILFTVCIFLLFLTFSPGEKLIKGLLEDQIKQYSGLDAQIGLLETNIFSRLTLDSVNISNSIDSSRNKLLGVEQIHIEYDIWSILDDQFEVKLLSIDSIRVDLHRNNEGKFAISFIDSMLADTSEINGGDTGSLGFKLTRATISNADIGYEDAALLTSVNLSGVNIDLSSQDLSAYAGSLTIEDIEARYDTLPVFAGNLKLLAKSQNGMLDINDLNLMIEDQLNVSGYSSLGLTNENAIEINLDLNGNVNSIYQKIRPYFELPELRVNDILLLNINATGSLQNPSSKLTCKLPSVATEGFTVDSGFAQVRFYNDTIKIDTLAIALFEGALSSRGLVILDSIINPSIEFDFQNVNLAQLWSAVYEDISPYRGKIEGRVGLNGSGNDYGAYNISSDFKVAELFYENQSLPDVNVLINFANNEFQLNISHDIFDIVSDIHIKDSTLKGNYYSNVKDIAPLLGIFNIEGVSGSLIAKGNIAGNLANPQIDAEIVAQNVNYQNIPIDTLHIIASYDDSGLSIDTAMFNGVIHAVDKSNSPFFLDSLSGRAIYKGKLSGTIANPVGSIDFRIEEAKYKSYSLDSLNTSLIISGQNVTIDSSYIFINNLSALIDGKFNIQNNYGNIDLCLHSHDTIILGENHSISESNIKEVGKLQSEFILKDMTNIIIDAVGDNIDVSPFIKIYNDSLDINGNLDFGLSFNGSLDNPSIELIGNLNEVIIDSILIDSVNTQVGLTNNKIELNELGIYGLGQKFQAIGSAVLAPDSMTMFRIDEESLISGQIVSDSFDLSIINPFLPYPNKAHGEISIDLKIGGNYSSPSLFGELTLINGMFSRGPEFQEIADIEIDALVHDTSLILNKLTGRIDKYPFDVKGSILLTGFSYIETDLTADFISYGSILAKGKVSKSHIDYNISLETLNLSVFESMASKISQLSGLIKSEIHITGSPEDPEIDGKLSVDQLSVKQKLIPSKFTEGKINIIFNKDKIIIDSSFINLGGGEIAVKGQISHDLAQITDVDLIFGARNILLIEPKEFQLSLKSAKLTYKKQDAKFILDGDIEFGESRLLHRFKTQAILPWAQSVEQTQMELPPFMMNTNMNIRIRESDKLWIDNNLAKTRLRAEIGVIGNPYKPNLTGHVKMEEGYFLYLDRKFKVEKGEIYFYDPSKFNPEINILANTEVTAYQGMQTMPYKVAFSAEGLLDELKIGLNSDPPLEKSDIVSLLTFGSTRSQLAGKDSDTKGVLKDRAQMFTSQRISSYVSRKAGSFLGLDEMSVKGNIFQLNRGGGPQISAAKKVSAKAKITYSTTVGHSNDQSIRLDYYLSNRYSLLGQTDRAGSSSIDLKYSIRFK